MPLPTAARHPVAVALAAGSDPAPGLALAKKVIAVIGVNAPGFGLLSAIFADPRREFAARAILDEAAMGRGDGRSFAELGADLQKGHARDEASLRAGFAGAYGAFYIQLSSDHATVETRRAVAEAVAGAAKAAGLRHLIWATLEDPGQALLQHDDLTPTFVEGRWISDEKAEEGVEEIFVRLGVPVTFLQTSWDPSVVAGSWTEDIGRYAYTLLRNVESIGKSVAISAARLIRGIPDGLPLEGARTVPVPMAVSEGPSARARVPPAGSPVPRPLSERSAVMASAGLGSAPRWRTIGIAGAIVAGGLLGLLIARQVGRQIWASPPVIGDRTSAAKPPPEARAITASQPPHLAAPVAPPAPSAEPPAPAAAEPPPGPVGAEAEAAPAAAVDSTPSNHGPARRQPVPKGHPTAAHRPTAAPSALAAAASPAVGAARLPPSEKPASPVAAAPAEAPHSAHPVPVAKPVAAAAVATPQPPAAAAPAAPAATARPGYVDPKAVSAAVRAHAAEARGCYDRAIMEHPDLHGRLTIHATIDPAGRVLTLTPTSDIAEGGRLQTCLLAAFKSWSFLPPAGGVNGNISYGFAFDSEIAR